MANRRNGFLGSIMVAMALGVACLAMASPAQAEELRAFWIDAWGAGALSQTQVDTLLGKVGSATNIGQIREANCNAVFVQVRRRADTMYPSAMGEPYMSGLTPSNFNGLQAVIDAAHDTTGGKQRIEVHAWVVAFKTSASSPVYLSHNNPSDPENYWITRYDSGSEVADYPLDPGHPRASEYLTNVCMDVVRNYDVDGLHYDYIRFSAANEGYNPTSVARFNARYGRTGQPSASDSLFLQWRRDQISDFVRRVYAHTMKYRPEVKISGAVVTWAPSPSSSTRSAFMNTRPYYQVLSDFDAWMQEGTLDLCVTMNYFDQSSRPTDYANWMNFQKDRKFNRETVVGPGIYMNTRSNAITQLLKTRDASPAGNYAHGFCGYSYRIPYSDGSWTAFSPYLTSQVTPSPTTIPDLPWKSNPTKGHMMGTVTFYSDGTWADGAQVNVTGPVSRSITCDGTGFYAFIDLPPGNYTVTASTTGYADVSASVSVSAGQMTEKDLQFGGSPAAQITNVQASSITNSSATITWTTDQAANSQVEYGTTTAYGSASPLNSSLVTAHTVNLTGLAANTLYHYRVISGNDNGTTTSADFTFRTTGPPQITDVQVTTVTANSATITWTTNAPATSQVRYGLTSAYGSQTALDSTLVTNHSVTVTGLASLTTYHFQAVSTNAYGSSQSSDATFKTTGPPVISGVEITGVTAYGATILWTTDVLADSQVEYGLTLAYGSATTLDPTLQTAHAVFVGGLQPSTPYYFRVRSANAAGTAYSADMTFTTIADVPDIVIDNLDSGWTNTSPSGASWGSGSIATVPKIGTNYLYATGTGNTNESSATRKCTWTPNLPIGGLYDVYAFFQMGTNRTSAAPYKIFYDGGELLSTQNQYSTISEQGDWVRIGLDLPFQAGSAGYVQLSNNTPDNALVSADAVKFIYKGTGELPPAPAIITAVSRKTHGGAGIYDVDVFVASSIEGRTDGPTKLIVAFDAEIQGAGGLSVSDVSLSAGSITQLSIVNDTELHIGLTGVASGSVLTVSFPGITGLNDQEIEETVCVRVLTGDTTNDGQVNIFDLVQVRNELNQAPNDSTFTRDVTADGAINIFDLVAVRNNLNQSVPACP